MRKVGQACAVAVALAGAARADAQVLVLSASGAGAGVYPAGTLLAAGARIAPGDVVKAIDWQGRRTLHGPATVPTTAPLTRQSAAERRVWQVAEQRAAPSADALVCAATGGCAIETAGPGPLRPDEAHDEDPHRAAYWLARSVRGDATAIRAALFRRSLWTAPLRDARIVCAPSGAPVWLSRLGGRYTPALFQQDGAGAPLRSDWTPAAPEQIWSAAPATTGDLAFAPATTGRTPWRMRLVRIAMSDSLAALAATLADQGCMTQFDRLTDALPGLPRRGATAGLEDRPDEG
ncbi:hypothetical protein [Sphingomonas jatrophae]|uniref:Uncharacterized protein n=1 Tax=Sphingomonas jatrophae TaxID=1166337 RepID=A0A1I6L533_9SPHN|nr:hypothetical protein [Sphingomonas jatrophae]SFR98546.1 hypothetical protein SAMN05192580_2301 [Sphingomonas jatrophae]